MPTTPKTICPGCRRAIVPKGERCANCKAKPSARPRKEADPFYSSAAWRKIRATKLANDPLCECEDCKRMNRTTPADTVDHRIERSDDPSLELTYGNLVSMNRSCHNRKTARERARRNPGGTSS